jgi:hypothetical protein
MTGQSFLIEQHWDIRYQHTTDPVAARFLDQLLNNLRLLLVLVLRKCSGRKDEQSHHRESRQERESSHYSSLPRLQTAKDTLDILAGLTCR